MSFLSRSDFSLIQSLNAMPEDTRGNGFGAWSFLLDRSATRSIFQLIARLSPRASLPALWGFSQMVTHQDQALFSS